MKVLWFSNSPAAAYEHTIKGTGGWMASLDKAIQHQVELHVAYFYPYRQEVFKSGNTTYHPIYTGNILLSALKRRLGVGAGKSFLNDCLQVIEQVRPDIIHIHGSENSFIEVAKYTDIPLAVSIQGNLSVYAHKYLCGFHGKHLNATRGKLTVKSFILGRRSFKDGKKDLERGALREQRYMPYVRHIIGRTDWDYRISRILAPKSQYYVGNEILRDLFYEKTWNNCYESGKLVLHTTNGDNYYKGFETLCHCLHLLNSLGLDVEWRVAGVNSESTINQITKQHLKGCYPDKGLVLMGSLDQNQLVDSLLSSHLYVMPSHIENSPNNLCEAMILGLPCIATHAGGTASILRDGEEGFIIQDGDPWAMAGAIIEMMGHPEQMIRFGQNARATALNRHDRSKTVEKLIDTYRLIIKEDTKERA